MITKSIKIMRRCVDEYPNHNHNLSTFDSICVLRTDFYNINDKHSQTPQRNIHLVDNSLYSSGSLPVVPIIIFAMK